MNKKIFLILFTLVSVFIGASISFAQNKTDFKVGETIYINAYNAGCVKATVKQTEPKYYVHIEEGSYKDRDTFYRADRLGECPQAAAAQNNNQTPNEQPAARVDERPAQPPAAAAPGAFRVGDRVDVYLSGGTEGKNRGTIIEASGSQYKIRYDGCAEKYDAWESFALVHPAAAISADSAEIKFLSGKWSMTTVAVNADAYGTIAAWGRSPGIQINSDGTYIWYQGDGEKPVEGEWQPHAKIEGTRYGTETQNGVLIYDAKGYAWKIYRRKSTIDNNDHITAQLMCSGETKIGTRAR